MVLCKMMPHFCTFFVYLKVNPNFFSNFVHANRTTVVWIGGCIYTEMAFT